jgi:hypothetical protein
LKNLAPHSPSNLGVTAPHVLHKKIVVCGGKHASFLFFIEYINVSARKHDSLIQIFSDLDDEEMFQARNCLETRNVKKS